MADLCRSTWFLSTTSSSDRWRPFTNKIKELYDEAIVHAKGLCAHDPIHLGIYHSFVVFLKSLGDESRLHETIKDLTSKMLLPSTGRLEEPELKKTRILVDDIWKLYSQHNDPHYVKIHPVPRRDHHP